MSNAVIRLAEREYSLVPRDARIARAPHSFYASESAGDVNLWCFSAREPIKGRLVRRFRSTRGVMMKRQIGTIAIAAAVGLAAAQSAAQDSSGMPLGPVSQSNMKSTEAPPTITPAQRARLNEKLALVSRLLAQMEPGAKAEGLSAGWRQSTMNSLFALSNETLASLSNVGSPSALPKAIASAKRVAPKALGDSTQDLVYTPITPCRYIDTRNVGGAINGTRSYDFDLNSYGGNCPNDPYGLFGGTLGAIAANVAIVAPSTAPGFATIVPVGTSPSVALVNWYESGAAVQASNAAIITNDQSANPAEVDIFTSSTVHVIVDIFGAFRAPQATALQCVNASATVNVAAGSFGTATATCPAGYTVTGGGYDGFSSGTGAQSSKSPESYPSGNGWYVFFNNDSGGAFTMETYARCCRVPGR
jgi:hypothetical protein